MSTQIERVKKALEDLRQGKMIILTDHPDRENEGDLIIAAESITADAMNFMIRNGTGIVCLSLTNAQLKKLQLPLMVSPDANTSFRGTPFTVSIDAKEGITTGVSAADRTQTILVSINPHAKPEDLVKPGHIFPLAANDNGVLERQGHTEGAIDLVRLAGFMPAAVLCEVMNMDGTMARGKQLTKFAEQHQLTMLSIDDIVMYRLLYDLIEEEASASLPLENYGEFAMTVIKQKITGEEHIILSKENKNTDQAPLVRIHSSCITGDLFHSKRCDCHRELHYSLEKINAEGGILIYLLQEGRGIGLLNKIKAYALQEQGLDTVDANKKLGLPADSREYYLAANILLNRGINKIRLMTNNPDKINNLQKYGITEIEREAIPTFLNEFNQNYLKTKKEKLNHIINLDIPELKKASS